MRKRLFSVLVSAAILVGLSLIPSRAEAFPLNAYASVTPFQTQAQVTNYFAFPITCAVRVQGLRNDGFSVWGETRAVLYPGISTWATAYTTAPFYFVNAWAFAECL